MSLNASEMSPADFGAIMGNQNDSFGGNGAWWLIILFLFAICGGGWSNGFGGGSQGAANNYVLASDFATIQRQLSDGFASMERKGDSISNGLCDGFYAQNTTMLNGFSGVQNAIATGGYETRNAITQAQIAEMQNANALQAQLAQCCCDNRAAIADVKYAMAQNASATQNAVSSGFCQTNFNAQSNTRDIIDSQNANTRAILDAIQANKVEALKDRIAEQNQQINALNLAASQQAQNAYLIDQLGTKCPIPAYLTCNPNAPLNYSVNYGGCGCNA